MKEVLDIFKRKPEDYITNLDPVNNYIKQTATYVSKMKDIPYTEAVKVIKKQIKSGKATNPEVKYRYRKDNGDRIIKFDKLTDYIQNTIDKGDIIVPTFSTYDHPDKKMSLHSQFLQVNIDKRKIDKANAFKYKQEGDADKYLHYDTLQKVRKVFNNSLSGAYASMSTIVYHPSNHSTLTSMTRSVASIGNAVSESIIAGNKHFGNPEVTINYIVSIVSEVNMKAVNFTMHKYNLYTPTVDEVMEMILYSSRNYWTDPDKEYVIKEFLTKLTGDELAAVMYVNDLHHMKKYNNDFIYTMLSDIAERKTTGSDDPLTDCNTKVEGVMNLVHHICMYDIVGMNINYKELATSNPDLLMILGSTAKSVSLQLIKYRALFRTFLTTDVLPVDIANIRDMLRDAIVLSDTDSTCGSYDKWVEWYYGHPKYDAKAVALAATVMTINTQVIDHNLKILAKNMNVPDERSDLLKMKNEYFWSIFVTSNVSKHYFASTRIREGNVFEEPELELKGVHLIASATNQVITNRAHDIMREITEKLNKGELISVNHYGTLVADMERDLLNKIESGDISIFKKDKIKEASSYKLDDPSKTPYLHHMLWEEIFSSKYGTPGEPTYMVIKVPTTLVSKRKMTEYLETVQDTTIRDTIATFIAKHNKTHIGTFRLPVAIVGSKGIPKELIPAIDKHKVVLDNLKVLYMVLETISLYRNQKMLLSEMGY